MASDPHSASRVIAGILAAPAALARDAHAAFAPDLATLTSSPWGAWSVFAIAITLVIVLLLWYAVDDDALDEPASRAGQGRRSANGGRSERQDKRRAA
jgi:hypothetical protein